MTVDEGEGTVRTTVTIPKPSYEEIERIAKEKRVSVAWVVREAVTEYLATGPGAQFASKEAQK